MRWDALGLKSSISDLKLVSTCMVDIDRGGGDLVACVPKISCSSIGSSINSSSSLSDGSDASGPEANGSFWFVLAGSAEEKMLVA